MKKKVTTIVLFAAFILACKHQIIDPGGGGGGNNDTPVCFEADILPIFQSNCAKSGCHDASTAENGYVFDSYNNIVKKGIKPGNAEDSKVYKVMIATDDDRMPPDGYPPLTKAQTDLVAQWINEGAQNTTDCGEPCDENVFTYSGAVRPILDKHCVGCHNSSDAGGGVDLTVYDGSTGFYDGVKQVALDGRLVSTINWEPGFSAMPQGGEKLSTCNISQITKWVNDGAPNN